MKNKKDKVKPMFPNGMFIDDVYKLFEGTIMVNNGNFNSLSKNEQDYSIIQFLANGGVVSQGTA